MLGKFNRTFLFQDQPYSMTLQNLGHAVIINNVAKEVPGSNVDVSALRTAYQSVGFQVHVHTNCIAQVRSLKSLVVLVKIKCMESQHTMSNIVWPQQITNLIKITSKILPINLWILYCFINLNKHD